MNGFVFDKGIDITPVQSLMGFTYGAGVFGPEVEIRRLEDIRASLRDPQCKGPEQVYSIAMDVGKEEHRALLNKLHLLFGVVTYSAGKLGQEPVRSQGHIHKISPYSGSDTVSDSRPPISVPAHRPRPMSFWWGGHTQYPGGFPNRTPSSFCNDRKALCRRLHTAMFWQRYPQ